MEPIDHPPGHEIDRLNKEIEERYSEDELKSRELLDWISPSQEAMETDSEDDPQTSLWQPDLTGADVVEIKIGIQPCKPED